MELRHIVGKYLDVAGGFGRPVALAAFGLERAETERVFSVYDEDYLISRYFHFSQEAGEAFQINGFPQTHVAIDEHVSKIL
jgi:hypothetical protein